MDVFLVVQLIHDVFKCALRLFWNVLHILDLVLQWLAVSLRSWCTAGVVCRSICLPLLVIVVFLNLLVQLIIEVKVKCLIADTVVGC